MNKLVWLRNDLRIHDNESFTNAFKSEKGVRVFAVYCVCDKQWDLHDVAPARRLLVIRTLIKLKRSLQSKGVTLIILNSGDYLNSVNDINKLAKTLECDEVFLCIRLPYKRKKRDKKAYSLLEQSNIRLTGHHHTCLLPIGSITKNSGEQYQVFTPFKNKFHQCIATHLDSKASFPILANDNWQQVADEEVSKTYDEDSLHILKNISLKYERYADICDLYLDDESKILTQLNTFCYKKINNYHTQRDIPQQAATSQISMYLSLGSLSIRTSYSAANAYSKNKDGYQTWINELLWREFYRNIIAKNRRLSIGYTFKKVYQSIPWKSNPHHIEAWKTGTTGVPIVDAAMRQLNQTGWMHNRLRMVTAMFLTKYLCIDWRVGEQYFMQNLVDGDFAANNGGWQWSASTGTDAAPYFRILSPIRQAERFDSDAVFIKKFIPELVHYTAKDICKLNASVWANSNYPQPIVDLKQSKNEVIALFKQQLHS